MGWSCCVRDLIRIDCVPPARAISPGTSCQVNRRGRAGRTLSRSVSSAGAIRDGDPAQRHRSLVFGLATADLLARRGWAQDKAATTVPGADWAKARPLQRASLKPASLPSKRGWSSCRRPPFSASPVAGSPTPTATSPARLPRLGAQRRALTLYGKVRCQRYDRPRPHHERSSASTGGWSLPIERDARIRDLLIAEVPASIMPPAARRRSRTRHPRGSNNRHVLPLQQLGLQCARRGVREADRQVGVQGARRGPGEYGWDAGISCPPASACWASRTSRASSPTICSCRRATWRVSGSSCCAAAHGNNQQVVPAAWVKESASRACRQRASAASAN